MDNKFGPLIILLFHSSDHRLILITADRIGGSFGVHNQVDGTASMTFDIQRNTFGEPVISPLERRQADHLMAFVS
jgi:hypothetical protein